MHSRFRAYTDGSCLVNPGGAGGVGCVYINDLGEETGRYSLGFKATTNNRMELMAAYYALVEAYRQCAEHVEITSDSRYVVDGANKYIRKWRQNNFKQGTVKNIDLWHGVDFYLQHMRCKFVWVKAHAGDHYNEIVDTLAYEAAHAPSHVDLGYEEIINE